jgi:hypothetical protein
MKVQKGKKEMVEHELRVDSFKIIFSLRERRHCMVAASRAKMECRHSMVHHQILATLSALRVDQVTHYE